MEGYVENRGAERKYHFDDMQVGQVKKFQNTRTDTLIGCAKYWAKKNGMNWKFRCFRVKDNEIGIIRVE